MSQNDIDTAHALAQRLHESLYDNSSTTLKELIHFCVAHDSFGYLAAIDFLLGQINAPLVSNTCLAALLRTTFRYRQHLMNWTPLRDQTAQVLRARGENAVHILRGLFG